MVGAPIRKGVNVAMGKIKSMNPCQIDYRKDESYWVFATPGEKVSVTYECNFDAETDKAIARIFLLELGDLKHPKIMNCPGIMYHDK